MEKNDNNGEGDRRLTGKIGGNSEELKMELDEGELERKIQRWICVEEKALVGAMDVFSDLQALGALVPVSTAYKRKKDKVRPLDRPTNGKGTGGDPLFLKKCENQKS